MNRKQLFSILALALLSTLIVAACGSSASESVDNAELVGAAGHQEAEEQDDEHTDEHTHSPDDHMTGAHNVPEDAAAVPNPIPADEDSVAAGAGLYATNCAICHGENGEGDGPTAASLEPKPADLHAGHVQELTDGALFYIISHGKPDTPMPAWENILEEDERWQVVNFLRTFNE